jgi:hypothetical protein
MLMLLDSSMLVSVASVDLGDPTFGFPVIVFSGSNPDRVCNHSCTSCTLLCQPLVCLGTRIRLYGFLVPNVFPSLRLLESEAGFQP